MTFLLSDEKVFVMLARIMRTVEAGNKMLAALAADVREIKEAKGSSDKSLPKLPVQSLEELDSLNRALGNEQLHSKLVRLCNLNKLNCVPQVKMKTLCLSHRDILFAEGIHES